MKVEEDTSRGHENIGTESGASGKDRGQLGAKKRRILRARKEISRKKRDGNEGLSNDDLRNERKDKQQP